MAIKMELNPLDILLQACNKLYPDLEVTIAIDSELAKSKRNMAYINKEENPIVIVIDPMTPSSVVLEIIVHELAHIILNEFDPICEDEASHSEEWKDIVRSMQVEYLRIQGEGLKTSKIFKARLPDYSVMN